MTTASPTIPDPHPALTERGFFRLSVADYHDMIENNIVTAEDRVEMLNGYLVKKPMQKSPHASTVEQLDEDLRRILPTNWRLRVQLPITLDESEPEPDICFARGNRGAYRLRHPHANEIGLIIEIADSSLSLDREVKGAIYSKAGIPEYWIVNLQDKVVEVYTQPNGTEYSARKNYYSGSSIPLVIDGVELAQLSVVEILP